jgi:serine/threonine protein kinase
MATSSVLAPIAEVAPVEMMRSTLSACSTPQLLDCRTDPLEDDYKMTSRVLGSGMNGDVRLAAHRETGERVAVKTFALRGMSESAEDDMCREMTVQAALDHPNVVRARDIFVSDEHVHIVTEALEGGNLLDRVIKIGMLGEHKARRAVEQVLKAVEYMHDLGFVHRDIKLQNLVYAAADRDTVKLIDFGLCRKWTDGERPMKRRCGTVQYLAPEVMQNSYTNKADMWSVGVVAHALLTGQDLGKDKAGANVLSDKLRGCSAMAQAFVNALLTTDPVARMSASEALTHSWIKPSTSKVTAIRSLRFGTSSTRASSSTADTLAVPQHVLTMVSLHSSMEYSASRASETSEELALESQSPVPSSLLSLESPRHAGRTKAWWAARLMGSLWSAVRGQRSPDRRVRPELYVMPSPGAR